MNIFSEIYGSYFRITAKLMKKEQLSDNEIINVVNNEGFRDSILFLPQKLIPQKDNSDLGLFKRNTDDTLFPVIKNKPVSPMTTLQKSG